MFTISGSQRVVPLCQSVLRDAKENREKKNGQAKTWGRGARFSPPGLRAVIFSSLEGLSERETTRSLD